MAQKEIIPQERSFWKYLNVVFMQPHFSDLFVLLFILVRNQYFYRSSFILLNFLPGSLTGIGSLWPLGWSFVAFSIGYRFSVRFEWIKLELGRIRGDEGCMERNASVEIKYCKLLTNFAKLFCFCPAFFFVEPNILSILQFLLLSLYSI